MLSAAEIDAMRATVVTSLAGSAVIKEPAWVSDGGGGGSTSWVAVGTAACNITPVSSVAEGQVVDGHRLHPNTEYIFTFEYDLEIDDESRIVYEDRSFDVTSIRAPKTFELGRRVEAREVV